MKKYIQPNIKVVEIEGQELLQISGPGVNPNGNITGPQRSRYQDDFDDFNDFDDLASGFTHDNGRLFKR